MNFRDAQIFFRPFSLEGLDGEAGEAGDDGFAGGFVGAYGLVDPFADDDAGMAFGRGCDDADRIDQVAILRFRDQRKE